VDEGAVGHREPGARDAAPQAQQQGLQRSLVKSARPGRVNAGGFRRRQVLRDRPETHTKGGSDLALRQAAVEFETENFLDSAHGNSSGRHRQPRAGKTPETAAGKVPCATATPARFGAVNTDFGIVNTRFGPGPKLFTINRNKRSRSAETTVHVRPKCLFTLLRNTHSGRENHVARIVGPGGDLPLAVASQTITLTLTDEIDISRGDVISQANDPVEAADQFEATLVWMGEAPMLPGRNYLMKIGTKTVTATVAPLKHKVNVNTLEHLAATKLELNEIGVVQLELDQPIAFEAYGKNRDLGGFILIDGLSNNTVGAGMLHFALRRSQNVHWQAVNIDRAARATLKGQKPCVLWFTGLSGSGKSTIANIVEKKLHAMGRHTYLLDGDNVRHGLNKDLGFTEGARVENIRRVAEVAKLMADAGLIVITAFISPFRSERRMARKLMPAGEFFEVFVDTPLPIAEARDPKGLYKKARRGELKHFTGIDSPYERPENAEMIINSEKTPPDLAADLLIEEICRRGH
jgi:adenylyl-sulfate kinase